MTYHAGPARDAGMGNGYGVPTDTTPHTTHALRSLAAVPSLATMAYAARAADAPFNLDALLAASTATPKTVEVCAVLRGRVVRRHVSPTNAHNGPRARCGVCNGSGPDLSIGSPTGRVRLIHAACDAYKGNLAALPCVWRFCAGHVAVRSKTHVHTDTCRADTDTHTDTSLATATRMRTAHVY
jgi:hypothetical protein